MPAPVITQTQATHVFDDPVLPQFTGTASSPIAWTAPSGSFSPATTASGSPTTYTPLNRTGSIVITGRNTGDNAIATVSIDIEAVFPYQPSWKAAGRALDQKTLMSQAEDNSPSFTEKGDPQRVYRYGFDGLNRRYTQWAAVEAFWLWHRKIRWFWIVDIPRALIGVTTPARIKIRFDSELSDDPGGMDIIPYSFVGREATDA